MLSELFLPVFIQKSGGGVKFKQLSHFPLLSFLGIKCYVLDLEAAVEGEIVSVVCWKTMNEQERNLGNWWGNTWYILCGIIYLVVVKHHLLF